MVEVVANFELKKAERIDADFELNESQEIDANFNLVSYTLDHNKLYNRDLPDQHPIEAITDLRDILNRLWTFIFEQEIAEKTWVVNHNLGRYPSFVVVDSAGNVQMPDEVTYNNDNQITISFISAFAGKAYFN